MAVKNESVLQLKQIHKIYLIKQLNVKIYGTSIPNILLINLQYKFKT